jgi:hypothetical protein
MSPIRTWTLSLLSYRCGVAVEVELAGQLLQGQARKQVLSLEKPVTVKEVALALGLDLEEVGLIVINGVQSEMEDIVPTECRLCFFPPMSGG